MRLPAPRLVPTYILLSMSYRGRNIANLDDLENGLKGLTHFNVLKGMPQAAQILANAVVQNKRIIIVGDFDADGATSTSVCILALGHGLSQR